MKSIFILPNLITASSMMCGMLAMFSAMRNDYISATHLIIVAAVLDFLDGKVARMTKSTSSFGAQFDSLADLVAFGVAPATLLYNYFTIRCSLPEQMAAGICAPFALCSALRLARFNVQSVGPKLNHFVGMPTPAGAACAVSVFYLLDLFPDDALLIKVVSPMPLVIAYLMVSRIKYPSLKKVALKRVKSFDGLSAVVLMAGMIIALRSHFREVVILVSVTYALLGIILQMRAILKNRGAAHEIIEADSESL